MRRKLKHAIFIDGPLNGKEMLIESALTMYKHVELEPVNVTIEDYYMSEKYPSPTETPRKSYIYAEHPIRKGDFYLRLIQ
jgi:hypothetical protein